jgi:sialate O-acetylesterase
MKKIILVSICSLALPLMALELPSVFSDHMVLQQEKPVRVWGKATPGSAVTVAFAGQEVRTISNAEGNWFLNLEPMEASFEGRELSVTEGGNRKVFQNVLVGEVWLASGQSNMAWEVRKSVDSDILILGANDPALRLHKVAYNASRDLEFTSPSSWIEDDPERIGWYSAVGYQFARDLRKTLGVPVGIIQSAVGGTPAVAWTRQNKIQEVPELLAMEREWKKKVASYDDTLAAWEADYAAWREEKGISKVDPRTHQRQGAPRKPEGPDSPRRPASLANGMISPVAGFTIRGMIWYQGEADAHVSPETYDTRLGAMIDDWRQWWGEADLPFGIVQLVRFQKYFDQPVNAPWPKIRESQRRLASSDPNIGLIATTDLGEANDIHPRDKFPVARRLARWALADVYGVIELAGGPQIVSATREGNSVLLRFDQTGEGLHLMDDQTLGGFTMSDVEVEPEIWWQTNFYAVEAGIHSSREVKLTIPEGKNPIRIRYAWQNNPVDATLTNIERLPASPFEIEIPNSGSATP